MNPSIIESEKQDWKNQLQHSIKNISDLIDFFGYDNIKNSPYEFILTKEYRDVCQKIHQCFRFKVTRYYLQLANINDPFCPILLQVLPHPNEIADPYFKDKDPLKEEIHSPIANLVHRYPDRVLWYISHHCAVYCRFCLRKRKVSNPASNTFRKNISDVIDYIKNQPTIKEVILSGGDPLSLEDDSIESILHELKNIPHLYSIRIHTRMLVTLPHRITKNLCKIFDEYYPITVVTHFNHPKELTEIVYEKVRLLRKSGVLVLNQSVLLKNINDDVKILEELFLKLIQFGIKPYYLHHCDEVQGTSHFRVKLEKALDIIRELQGRNPGIAIPKFMVDLPEGGGKVPLTPVYLKEFDREKKEYIFYNYEFKNLYRIKDL